MGARPGQQVRAVRDGLSPKRPDSVRERRNRGPRMPVEARWQLAETCQTCPLEGAWLFPASR